MGPMFQVITEAVQTPINGTTKATHQANRPTTSLIHNLRKITILTGTHQAKRGFRIQTLTMTHHPLTTQARWTLIILIPTIHLTLTT